MKTCKTCNCRKYNEYDGTYYCGNPDSYLYEVEVDDKDTCEDSTNEDSTNEDE